MTKSNTKTINCSSSDISHASPNTGSPIRMPQCSRHVRRWLYTIYGIPPTRYHRGYVVVSPKRSPRPYEKLQWAENTPYQQVRYGCPEEVSILHLLGAWSPTKAGANNIHLMDTAKNCAEGAVTRGWGKLHQSQPSWDQYGKDWCWIGMIWLEGEVCHKYGEYNRFLWGTLKVHHLQYQASRMGGIMQFQDGWREVGILGTNTRSRVQHQ